MTRFIVQTAAANMPSRCKGVYRRVAVLEVEPGAAPKMISTRARGVVRVVATWEKCHAGRRARTTAPRTTAYERAVAEAERMVARLEAARDPFNGGVQ